MNQLRLVILLLVLFGLYQRAESQNTRTSLSGLALTLSRLPDTILVSMSDSAYICNALQTPGAADETMRTQVIRVYELRSQNTQILQTENGTLIRLVIPDPANLDRDVLWTSWKYTDSNPCDKPIQWWSSNHLRAPDWDTISQPTAEAIVRDKLATIVAVITNMSRMNAMNHTVGTQ